MDWVGAKDGPAIDRASWTAPQSAEAPQNAEAQQCPSCRALVTELCGDDAIQQSWFRLAPEARRCSLHRGPPRANL